MSEPKARAFESIGLELVHPELMREGGREDEGWRWIWTLSGKREERSRIVASASAVAVAVDVLADGAVDAMVRAVVFSPREGSGGRA